MRMCLFWKGLIQGNTGFSVKAITGLNKEKDQKCTLCSMYSEHANNNSTLQNTQGGRSLWNQQNCSKAYTFPGFHTADSNLNSCYVFRTWCLIVTIVVPRCLPAALVAKDPSRNWLRVRKKCCNSLGAHLKPSFSLSFLGFLSFWKGVPISLLF